MTGFPQPLKGMTVLDLSLLLPGPYCTNLLAAFGAEIVKVEPKGIGDPARKLNPRLFAQLARGKASIALDLKTDEGRQTLRRMAAQSDALIEGFRPGVMDRLGVGHDRLREDNKRLVYCALSGFGQDGPYRDRPGHDLNFLGLAGYFAIPSQVKDVKSRPSVRMADLVAGQYAAFAMAMAMTEAGQTGTGAFLDCAIFDCIAAWSLPLLLAHPGAADMAPTDFAHVMGDSDIFETADGRFLTIGTLEDKFWAALAEVLAKVEPALVDPAFATRKGRDADKARINGLLAECFRQKSLDQWSNLLADCETTWAPVYEGEEMLDDPHFRARTLLRESDDGMSYGAFPVRIDGARDEALANSRPLGADGRTVLDRFGFAAAEIDALATSGAIELKEPTQ